MVDMDRKGNLEDVYQNDSTKELCRIERRNITIDCSGKPVKGVLLVFPDFRYEAIPKDVFVNGFTLHEMEKVKYDWENLEWT